jgi:betaine-aldehyde dehydrogenase
MALTEARSELAHVPFSPDGVALMLIDGAWTLASDGGTRHLIDPGTGEVIARVAEGTQADATRAIAAARAAFDHGPWRTTSAQDRAKLLFTIADALDARAEEFSRLETLDAGKPLRETEYDIADAANCFR